MGVCVVRGIEWKRDWSRPMSMLLDWPERWEAGALQTGIGVTHSGVYTKISHMKAIGKNNKRWPACCVSDKKWLTFSKPYRSFYSKVYRKYVVIREANTPGCLADVTRLDAMLSVYKCKADIYNARQNCHIGHSTSNEREKELINHTRRYTASPRRARKTFTYDSLFSCNLGKDSRQVFHRQKWLTNLKTK